MNVSPLVSVIIPCYRQAHFLADAVESVIGQTFEDWELVIVNDGSPDNTTQVAQELIARYPRHSIALIETPNRGVAAARNLGIRRSHGRYVLPLDADDMIAPTMLERCVELLESYPTVAIAYTHIQHFGLQNDVWPCGPFDLRAMIYMNRIAYCAMFRREVFESVGGYKTNTGGYCDWDFWLSALECGWTGQLIPEPLFMYRKAGPSMITEANQQRSKLLAELARNHPLLSRQDTGGVFLEAGVSTSGASNRRQSVLIACDYFWPSVGGVETIAENLGVYLQKQGYEVEIAARALPSRVSREHRGMRVHSIDVAPAALPWQHEATAELRRLILGGQYKAVILLGDPLTWVLWAAADLPKGITTRIIVQPLINDEGFARWKDHQEMRDRLRSMLRRADEVVMLTRSGRDALYLTEEGIPATFIPNATSPVTAAVNVRAELQIASEVPLLVHVGNLWPVKNQLGLLETLRPMAGDWHLVLVGHPTEDKAYVARIHDAVARDPRVTWVPGWPAEKVGALMDAAQLVLLPSLAEVSPVVLLEAMSHGRAWLATPCCGAVSELAGGLAAPLETFPVLIELLLADPALRQALGEAGRAHWRACFSWDQVGSVWKDLIENRPVVNTFDMPGDISRTMAALLQEVRGRLDLPLGNSGLGDKREESQAGKQTVERRIVSEPLVSVIVPTYNRPDLLVRAVKSIRSQTYRNIEIIVVNDGGVDVENIVGWAGNDTNLTYVRHGRNRGLAAARNSGLRVAMGEIIAYLDDDDLFLPEHVATLVRTLQTGDKPFAYTEAEYVLEVPEFGQMKECQRAKPYSNIPYSKKRLHISNYIPVNTWGHWKFILDKVGYFDETLDNHEDWEFLLRCSRHFDLQPIPKVTVEVHQQRGGNHMLGRERHKFYDTYRRIYELYDDLGDPEIAEGRQRMLSQLLASGETVPANGFTGEESTTGVSNTLQKYSLWRSKHTLQEIDAQLFAERMVRKWKQRPTFRLVLMLQPGQDTQLADTIDSLASQLYPGWRLVVVAPFAAPDPAFNEVEQLGWLEAHTRQDRVRAINALAAEGAGDWLWLLPGGARIEPHALLRWGDYIDLHPEWRVIYCDDDRILADGNFGDPWFKPDFNLDLLRSMDYVGPFLVRADALLEAGGYSALEGAETYDLLLRVLDRFGEASIGHVADVLLHLPGTGMLTWSAEAAMEAAREHLVRAGISGEVLPGYIPGTHRIVYRHSSTPLVSVIIPNRDKLEFLQPCVESLLEKTTYPNYEVLIVDNGSTDPDLLEYYRDLQQTQGERVRILAYDAPFNFSAMNNEAARQARGEYLLLLNNDTQIVQGEWLERMLCHGQRPEVGIVGARLVYPETGKLQHAGVVLGLRGVAEHVFTGELGLTDPGYMNRALVDQNYSAVTAACMLVRRSLFEEVDGFDEQSFAVSFNDVDLCLKIGKRGYKVVWTPYATVVHHGSASQKADGGDVVAQALKVQRFEAEHRAMLAKWLPILANDPAYNRHLSLQPPGYEVETAIVIDWDPYFHDRPRLLGLPLSGGSGEYRVISPFRALSRAALAHGDVIQTEKYFESRLPMPVELERAKPDTLVLQAALGDPALQAMADYRQFNGDVMLAFALDDLVTQMPPENPFFRNAPRDVRPRLRKALSLCDRVVVSTEPIAELCRAMHGDVRVIPNRLEKAIWGGLSSRRRRGTRARVGWAGAQQHAGDLALIVEVVKATAQEVDWVFFGMCPEALRPFVREYHDFVVSFYDYPAKLASLDLDLAVAPLAINPFNEAKSNLRLLEYGILGWPVVCTDIYPYRDAPVKRVPNTPEAWIEAIRERVYDLDAAEREGERLRQWVLQHYILEDHLDEWLQALTR